MVINNGLIIQFGWVQNLTQTEITITYPIVFPRTGRYVQIQATPSTVTFYISRNVNNVEMINIKNNGVGVNMGWVCLGY